VPGDAGDMANNGAALAIFGRLLTFYLLSQRFEIAGEATSLV
jgi:hypothetical protein